MKRAPDLESLTPIRCFSKRAPVKAWSMLEHLQLRPDDPPDWGGTVASWLMTGPFHPAWDWWTIFCVHLRPIAGARAPRLHFDGASHEFVVASLDGAPDVDAAHPSDVMAGAKMLQPLDVVAQAGGLTDAQAADMTRTLVRMCCAGQLSPDQDHRQLWCDLIRNTAQHIVLGGHPKGSA